MDSAADICAAVLDVLHANDRTEVTARDVRGYIGRHLADLFSDLQIPKEKIDPLIAKYREIYLLRKHSSTSVFPGVAEMLANLGGRKSTATTKGTPTTRAVLEQFGLLAHFTHVQGTDGFPAKPEPDVVHRALQALGARPEDCLLVGDAAADMEAGRRAGVRTCAVRWGYGNSDEMARWQPDYWIDRPAELLR